MYIKFKNNFFPRVQFQICDFIRVQSYNKRGVMNRDSCHNKAGFLFKEHGSYLAGQLIKAFAFFLLFKANKYSFFSYNGIACFRGRGRQFDDLSIINSFYMDLIILFFKGLCDYIFNACGKQLSFKHG